MRMHDKLKILVIDDEPDILELLTIQLSEEYIVDSTCSIKEFIKKACSQTYDILLVDITLKNVKSGFDIAKQLREECGLEDVPIIAYSNYPQNSVTSLMAKESGIDYYLEKSVPLSFLKETIYQTITYHQRRFATNV